MQQVPRSYGGSNQDAQFYSHPQGVASEMTQGFTGYANTYWPEDAFYHGQLNYQNPYYGAADYSYGQWHSESQIEDSEKVPKRNRAGRKRKIVDTSAVDPEKLKMFREGHFMELVPFLKEPLPQNAPKATIRFRTMKEFDPEAYQEHLEQQRGREKNRKTGPSPEEAREEEPSDEKKIRLFREGKWRLLVPFLKEEYHEGMSPAMLRKC